jgi:hypothetical protein
MLTSILRLEGDKNTLWSIFIYRGGKSFGLIEGGSWAHTHLLDSIAKQLFQGAAYTRLFPGT